MENTAEKFAAARRASGMTLAKAAESAGIRSINTYTGREDDPLQFRLGELKGMYDSMDNIGRPLLLEAVTDIFLPS